MVAVLCCRAQDAAPGGSERYMELFQLAEKETADQDYPAAARHLLEAMRLEPANGANVMLLSNLGMVYYCAGADSLAVATLVQAAAMAPSSVTINSNLARVALETGYTGVAAGTNRHLLELDSTLTAPRIDLALIAWQTDDHDQLRTMLAQLPDTAGNSSNYRLLALKAWTADMDGDLPVALKFYSRLIGMDPSAELYASRAMVHVKLENFTDASEDIGRALELDDSCSMAYLARACLKRRQFLNDEALADAQRAIQLGADPRAVRQLINY